MKARSKHNISVKVSCCGSIKVYGAIKLKEMSEVQGINLSTKHKESKSQKVKKKQTKRFKTHVVLNI
jgi:hypothetical protein